MKYIIKKLDKIGVQLFKQYGSDSYGIRCEIHDLKKQLEALNIPVVIDALVCDCEIPKPKSPFIGDYEYDYCRDCDGHISQTNYL